MASFLGFEISAPLYSFVFAVGLLAAFIIGTQYARLLSPNAGGNIRSYPPDWLMYDFSSDGEEEMPAPTSPPTTPPKRKGRLTRYPPPISIDSRFLDAHRPSTIGSPLDTIPEDEQASAIQRQSRVIRYRTPNTQASRITMPGYTNVGDVEEGQIAQRRKTTIRWADQ